MSTPGEAPQPAAVKSKLQVSPADVADMVRTLATNERFTLRTEQLDVLANDIWGGPRPHRNAGVWEGLDLSGLFSPESTITIKPRYRIAAWLCEIGAAIAVFLPVLITWLGFQAASAIFAEYVTGLEPGSEPLTFLQLWVSDFKGTDFKGRLDGHTLPWIALWDVLAILVAMLFIVGDRVVTRMSEARQEKDFQEASSELLAVLTYAQAAINVHDPRTPLDGLNELIENLQQVVGEMERLAGVYVKTNEAAETLRTATAELRASVSEVTKKLTDATSKTVGNFEDAIETANNTLRQGVVNAGNDLMASVSASAEVVEKSAKDAAGKVGQAVSQVTEATGGIKAAASGVASTQAALTNATKQVTDAQAQIATQVGLITAAVEKLKELAITADGALDDHTTAVEAQLSWLVDISKTLRSGRLG